MLVFCSSPEESHIREPGIEPVLSSGLKWSGMVFLPHCVGRKVRGKALDTNNTESCHSYQIFMDFLEEIFLHVSITLETIARDFKWLYIFFYQFH